MPRHASPPCRPLTDNHTSSSRRLTTHPRTFLLIVRSPGLGFAHSIFSQSLRQEASITDITDIRRTATGALTVVENWTFIHSLGWCNPNLHVTASTQCRARCECKTSKCPAFWLPALPPLCHIWLALFLRHTSSVHRPCAHARHPSLIPSSHEDILSPYGLMYHIAQDRSRQTHSNVHCSASHRLWPACAGWCPSKGH